jgi:hypothetical protein
LHEQRGSLAIQSAIAASRRSSQWPANQARAALVGMPLIETKLAVIRLVTDHECFFLNGCTFTTEKKRYHG